MTIAKVELYGRKVAVISAYAPNKFDKTFFDTLTQKMLELPEYSIIVGADMHVVWHADDRSSLSASKDQQLSTAALQSWAKTLGLIDVWRSFNRTIKDYSFFSARHKSFSRIDFLFTSPQFFPKVIDAALLLIYQTTREYFAVQPWAAYPARWRFNTTLLKYDDYKSQFLDFRHKTHRVDARSICSHYRSFDYLLKPQIFQYILSQTVCNRFLELY